MQQLPRKMTLPLNGSVFEGIRSRAAAADRGEISLVTDLQSLHDAGLLAEVVRATSVGGNTGQGIAILSRIGRESLPVGRIVEGHCNALRLIQLYGSTNQWRRADDMAAQGHIFGVWGAEGKSPVAIANRTGADVELRGDKQFCSGLGLLSFAVLPLQTDDGPLLVLANVQDQSRADPGTWQVSGMRATASGRYTVTGLLAEVLGKPGDYLREPHFEGGIWRYCAVHSGGLDALVDAVRSHVLKRGQENDPFQRQRLAQLAIQSRTAQLWVKASSLAVESGDNVASSVAQVLLARQAIEAACQTGIALAERCLGTSAFSIMGDADRIRRDLAFFLRQANLDGKLDKAADWILDTTASTGDMW